MSVDHTLTLQPFRGVRYAPGTVDLAAVTSPPYDLIGPDDVAALERQEPHNVVRLVLGEHGVADGYAQAGALLRGWLASGVLATDRTAALYVYEQRHAARVQRGLIGAVGLHPAKDGVVLPHEDVHPGPVADRLAQMRATRANLEPIYLLMPGTGAAAEVVAAAPDASRPLVDVDAPDGIRHRLWAIDDRERLTIIAAALRDKRALIADGHHRYATYRELQAAYRRAGRGAGPWDAGLALLVDSAAYPPTLDPIHRVVAGLDPDTLVAALPAGSTVRRVGLDLDAALAELAAATSPASYLVVGADATMLFSLPLDGVIRLMPADRSDAWRRLAVNLLHHVVLDTLLRVSDDDVTFAHSAAAAVEQAGRARGAAILLNPPTVEEVFAVAAAGDRMPRKSTSFGPKPRNGWVFRLLETP